VEDEVTGVTFTQLVDLERIRQLLEALFRITGMVSAILDTDENILVAVGWQDICTRFHRAHPVASLRCRESDAYIKAHLHDSMDGYLEYRCRNGLWDVAMPIFIGGEHLATIFTGQFFYDDDKPDPEFFRAQAREFGFDEAEYLSTLSLVQVCTREQIRNIMDFYRGLVQMMAEMGLNNLKLSREVALRERAETEVRELNEGLEQRVTERTAQLLAANEQLEREIAERKQAEEELRESRAKYQAIVDAFDGLIYICSQDYRVEFMSRKLIDRTGYNAVGEFCYKVLHDRDSVCPWCVNDRVFKGETVRWEMFSPKDRRWYYVVNSPIYHADGLMSKHSMIIDINERKLAEEQLKQQKQKLEELNSTLEKRVQEEVAKNREMDIILIQQNRQAALGEALEHIAHQWKQPLNTIGLLVQHLKFAFSYGELTEEIFNETVGKTMALLDHMAQTIDFFKDFYKPDREKTLFRLKESVDKALSFIEPAFRQQNITVEYDADPELWAQGYPKGFVQVLLIILTNARDAFRERKTANPRLAIKAFAEDKEAVVTITDNAGGIPDNTIGNVFDLYFTTREASGGTGIGLYMAKSIIEKHMGGRLGVANVEDGTQFRIEVNRSEKAPGA
jgi:C4-dicarboxylate-specific signal transduction histidine kinase